jgi:hypothetical protein
MRRVLLLLLFAAPGCSSCKRTPPPTTEAPAPIGAAPAAPQAPDEPQQPISAAFADLSPAAPRTAPADAEVRKALEPLLPLVEKCVKKVNGPNTGDLLLRFRIAPGGEIDAAQVLGLEPADECVRVALRPLKVAPFGPAASVVEVPMNREGRPADPIPRG